MQKHYDIFVSYRREGGEDKARILNQHLSAVGYNVFFDHEAAITGEFETVILAAVEIAPIFLMLMTPGCFDRCVEEGDWVRREIEHAKKFGKEIIPISPNDEFTFKNLPKGIPTSVLSLKDIQFAGINFHKHFKATANEMIEERLKPIVKPSIETVKGDNGAEIHFFSDISCRVYSYGNQIAVTDAADKKQGTIARMLKGRHMMEYISIEHEDDSYEEVITVADNDYIDFINVKLRPIKEKRLEEEAKQKDEEERLAREERERLEQERSAQSNNYKYDFFFSYSRQDASVVRQIFKLLTDSGYKCWMDMDGIASGYSFKNLIFKAIQNSQCLLFFHSEHSDKSKWAQNELQYALHLQKMVLPIKLDKTDYSSMLMFELGNINYLQIEDRRDYRIVLDTIKKMEIGKPEEKRGSFFSTFFKK